MDYEEANILYVLLYFHHKRGPNAVCLETWALKFEKKKFEND